MPMDTGILRGTLSYRIEGNSIIFTVDSPYAEYIEYGTGIYHTDEAGHPEPHSEWDVYAKPPPEGKGFLAWESGRKSRLAAHKSPKQGNWIYAQHVHIKGMHPHPFMRPAFHQNMTKIKKIIQEEFEKSG